MLNRELKRGMIISHKHKFIFFKTRKTAGTSLEMALGNICGDDDIISSIWPPDENERRKLGLKGAQNNFIPLGKYTKSDILVSLLTLKRREFYSHMTCSEVKRYVSKDIWDTYYKFSVERDPFDKMVSLYFWRGGDEKYKCIYDFLTKGGLAEFNSYDIYSIDGVVAVNDVFKFEDMTTCLEEVSKKIGLKKPLELLDFKAKSKTRKVTDYKDILDKRSIELISTIFAREIKLLDYQSPEV